MLPSMLLNGEPKWRVSASPHKDVRQLFAHIDKSKTEREVP